MTFNDVIVMVVFAILGYLIVASVLNWLDEKKAGGARKEAGEPAAPPAVGARRIEAPSMLPSTDEASWFRVLEVAEDASWEKIVEAYQAKMHQYHPDKVAHLAADLRDLADKRLREIEAAYDEALKARGR